MTTLATPQIDGLVRRTRALDVAWRGLAIVGWGVALSLVVAGLSVAIDALFGPGPSARIGVVVALLVVWCVGLGVIVAHHVSSQSTTLAWLHRIERACGLRHNRLVSAWQLARHDGDTHLSLTLTRAAIDQGEALVPSVAADRVVAARPALRALLVMMIAAVLLAAAYAALPGVFHATVPRLLAPWADLPAYTPLRFDIAVDPSRPDHGDTVQVTADILGPPFPPEATLVVDPLDGSPPVALPMPRRRVISDAANASSATPIGAAFRLPLEAVTQPFRFHVDTPHGRSAWQRLDITPTPKLRHADLTVAAPAYAHRPDRTVPLADRHAALIGSSLTIDVLANLPLAEAHLTLDPILDNGPTDATAATPAGQRPAPTPHRVHLAINPDAPQQAVATLTLDRSYRYTLDLVGPTGLTLREPRTGTLHALPDHPPAVTIDRPTQHARVVVGYPISIDITAQDDVGLARVMLQQRLPNDRPVPVDLLPTTSSHPTAKPPSHQTTTHTLDTAALGLVAGDVVTYHAAAVDTHPVPTQHTITDTHTVTIITLDEFHALLAEQQRRQQQQALAEAVAMAVAAANPLYGKRKPDGSPSDQPREPQLNPNTTPDDGLTPDDLRHLANTLDQLADALDATDNPPADLPTSQEAREAAEAARRLAEQLAQGQPLDQQDIDTLAECLGQCMGSGMGQGQGGSGFGSGGGAGNAAGGSGGAPGGSAGVPGPGATSPGNLPVTLVGPATGPAGLAPSDAAAAALGNDPRNPNAVARADGQSGDNGLPTTPYTADRLTPTRTEALIADPASADPALIADIADLPPAYRDEAAAYFRRLANDAANRQPPE
ncbi:MAG: hypothetical protein AAGA57_07520 [Planctomycetota bacterium]